MQYYVETRIFMYRAVDQVAQASQFSPFALFFLTRFSSVAGFDQIILLNWEC